MAWFPPKRPSHSRFLLPAAAASPPTARGPAALQAKHIFWSTPLYLRKKLLGTRLLSVCHQHVALLIVNIDLHETTEKRTNYYFGLQTAICGLHDVV
jgi:hypothetical protein